MDKKLIEKYNLNKAVRRFQQINEYTFIGSPLSEDDDDNNIDTNANPDDIQDDNTMSMDDTTDVPNDENMGNEQDMQGEAPMSNDGEQPDAGMEDAVEDEVPDDTMPNAPSAIEDADPNAMQPDDEVIDVSDLTDAQEEADEKMDVLAKHITQMVKAVDVLKQAIDANNNGLMDLKADFARRNPTETEKLNLRSQSSYPYNTQPTEYWQEKQATNPQYEVTMNNDIAPNQEPTYTISYEDVANIGNENPMTTYDSMDYPFDLKKALDF